MPQFIPVSDLRYYNKVISQITHENPVYLTRHGRNATLAIVDANEYERLKKQEASTKLLEALRKGALSGEQRKLMARKTFAGYVAQIVAQLLF